MSLKDDIATPYHQVDAANSRQHHFVLLILCQIGLVLQGMCHVQGRRNKHG